MLLRDNELSYEQISHVLFLSDEAVRKHVSYFLREAKLAPENGGSRLKTGGFYRAIRIPQEKSAKPRENRVYGQCSSHSPDASGLWLDMQRFAQGIAMNAGQKPMSIVGALGLFLGHAQPPSLRISLNHH